MSHRSVRGLALVCLIWSACGVAQAGSGLPDGDYYVVSQLSYKMLTAYSTADGAIEVAQFRWSALRDPGQTWALRRDGDGDGYSLYSRKYGRYLAVPGASREPGTWVSALAGEEGRRQRWRLRPYADSYNLVAAHSGLALNLRGGLSEEGTNFLQWEVPGNAQNERFLLIATDAGGHGRHAPDPNALENSHYDNFARRYHLVAQVSAGLDADRTRRMKGMEYHPTGLYVKRGEMLDFTAEGLPAGRDALVAMVGPANGFYEPAAANDPAEQVAVPGDNHFRAPRAGMLYFRYVDSEAGQQPLPAVDVRVTQGGSAVPFYIDGQTSDAQWRDMLEASRTPYIEMVGPRAVITVRRDLYERAQRSDPARLLGYLEQVIALHDSLSGLDGATPVDRPSPLRLHYLQDDVSPASVIADVFMYATDNFIAMPGNSALALLDQPWATDPWAIWHETGHLYQQRDWTWEAVAEVTVNLYALHAQQRLGLPSRLAESDPQTGRLARDAAAEYLARPRRAFNDDAAFPEREVLWARLVMFERLRSGLGDEFYRKLHRYYRRHPLTAVQFDDQGVQVQEFIYRSSLVARVDLTEFFRSWGLPISRDTERRTRKLRLPAPNALALVR